MPPPSSNQPSYRYAYTVVLYIMSVFFAMTVFTHQLMITQLGPHPMTTALFRYLQALETILCVVTLSVAILRSKGSPLARPTTAAVSILLVLWVPFGTAMFIWWVASVRKQERPK